MPAYFEPYLSYRQSEKGGGILDFGRVSSGNSLRHFRSIVFFVHGYNNEQLQASASYSRFVGLLGGNINVKIVGVYWPGDNWAGGAYYLNALNKVGTIAKRFARDLHTSGKGGGNLEVSFVAHSLGCRLTLETIRELNGLMRTQPLTNLKIRRAVFMAGAVATYSLEARQPLNVAARDRAVATKSIYSEADRVLQLAFPLGQGYADRRFLPTALGRRRWGGGVALNPTLEETENPRAGHSDYWGGESMNALSLRYAAYEVRKFIPFGGPPPPRASSVRATTSARALEPPRQTPVRRRP